MFEVGEWVAPQVVNSGCCEGSRWQLRVTGPDNDRFQSRLAGLAVNPAAPADVLLAVASRGGRLPRLVLGEHLSRDLTFKDEYPSVVAALVTATIQTGDPYLLERMLFEAVFPAEAIVAFAASPDHRVRAKAPFMTGCPAQTKAVLADDPHPDVRRHMACLVTADLSLLIKLARDPDPMVRQAIGDREELPAAVAAILAQDPVSAIRACVIEDADDSLAEELALDADPRVRAAAAGRGRLSVETMMALACDDDALVRRALGWNDGATAAVLTILAADPDPEARRAVALRAATPVDVLAGLIADPDDLVARTAITGFTGSTASVTQVRRPLPSMERLESNAERLSVEQLRDLLGHDFWSGCIPGPRPWLVEAAEDARRALLTQCAVSRFARLRAMAAADWRLPRESAATLAEDRDPMVRRRLAKHCQYPDALSRLAEQPTRGVADALAGNYFIRAETLERLPAKPHRLARNRNASAALLTRLLDGADHVTRLAVAEHFNTPPEVLAELARGDFERDVVRAACAHPALPLAVMGELAGS